MAMNTYEKVKSFVHEKEKVLFMGWQCPSRVKAVWAAAYLMSLVSKFVNVSAGNISNIIQIIIINIIVIVIKI